MGSKISKTNQKLTQVYNETLYSTRPPNFLRFQKKKKSFHIEKEDYSYVQPRVNDWEMNQKIEKLREQKRIEAEKLKEAQKNSKLSGKLRDYDLNEEEQRKRDLTRLERGTNSCLTPCEDDD